MVEKPWLPYNVIDYLLHVSSHSLICDEVHYIKGRILTQKNIDKRTITDFVIFLNHSTKEI